MSPDVVMNAPPVERFGCREPPFRMTPDARLFFPSEGHRRAAAHLLFGLSQNEGFVVVTGEIGAGKTTLVEHLCSRLDRNGFMVARVATTQISGDELLRLVAPSFGATAEGDKAAVLRSLTTALHSGTRRHLLIVDEAQGLPVSALEELRMLSNLAEGGRALLQTILVGQPQLRDMLASPGLEQLRQRVLASFHLGSLARAETHAYVQHRMRAVGWVGSPAWDPAALDLVHDHSAGIPRRINRLCARVLLGAELEQATHLTASLVAATALELEDDLGGRPDEPPASAAQDQLAALTQRVGQLERLLSQRERVFERFRDLFADERMGLPR